MWNFSYSLKALRLSLKSACLALLVLAAMPSALHAGTKAKTPPLDDLPPTTGGQSAGSRGCGVGTSLPLQLVIPPLHLAQTATTTPTLLWYQDAPVDTPVEFRVFEYDTAQRSATLHAELMNPQTRQVNGLTVLDWPQTLSELTPGKQYIWQVELVCNPNRPSGNIFADAPLKVLPRSETTSFVGYEALAPLLEPSNREAFQLYQNWMKQS